jgi:uncharacterized membrane protein YphA (DoxX/SURF4 family)
MLDVSETDSQEGGFFDGTAGGWPITTGDSKHCGKGVLTMAIVNNESFLQSVALLVNRLIFGGVVVAQSVMYMLAGEGSMYGHEVFYREVYKPLDPGFLPAKVSMYYAYSLPYVALFMGVFVLVGIFARFASLVLLIVLLTGLGALLHLHGVPKEPKHLDVYLLALAGLALLFTAMGPGRFSLDKYSGGGGGKKPKAEGKDKD